MKENSTILQVLYIDDKVKWKHLKEYEMDKHEHTESHEHRPLWMILATIRKLQFATRRHVISIHEMGSIRNAKRIMRDIRNLETRTTINEKDIATINKQLEKISMNTTW
ncbi:hypothetical protein, partial [Bacillus wiedmannii]|uniref:hypothetical protein n=1 Tax=Bacillus wiedmannii TaxID=1890302 RepID=UPI00211D608A